MKKSFFHINQLNFLCLSAPLIQARQVKLGRVMSWPGRPHSSGDLNAIYSPAGELGPGLAWVTPWCQVTCNTEKLFLSRALSWGGISDWSGNSAHASLCQPGHSPIMIFSRTCTIHTSGGEMSIPCEQSIIKVCFRVDGFNLFKNAWFPTFSLSHLNI